MALMTSIGLFPSESFELGIFLFSPHGGTGKNSGILDEQEQMDADIHQLLQAKGIPSLATTSHSWVSSYSAVRERSK
jgi:hypothetical protein